MIDLFRDSRGRFTKGRSVKSRFKGKTLEEYYGIEKAQEIIKKRSKSISENNARYWLGKKQPLELIAKRILKLKNIPCSEVAKEKIRNSLLGHPVSEETRHKLRISNKGKHSSKHTEFVKGSKLKQETKIKIKGARRFQIFPIKDTSIEIKIQYFLKKLDISFFTHQYIKEIEHGYQCDILIPSMNLVIECDGNYWHRYPIGKEIDHIRTSELIDKGFKVLRLWEIDIKKMSFEDFKGRLNL